MYDVEQLLLDIQIVRLSDKRPLQCFNS